jgi:hypothetical protein
LKEAALAYEVNEAPMVRTQIYLSEAEHAFVQKESSRLGKPMAAIIRLYIDEKMTPPEDAWTHNPMLDTTPRDPEWQGHEDGGINHDHYVYGTPKKMLKVKGKYVEAPILDGDDSSKESGAKDRKTRKPGTIR